eukprot:TRINITY_DN7637_c0_g1_i1.p1 TRINITY_DN7637_c0_g1~~TRINITY_DN7637_c0_g1_i1.p1  ORF type:complete len:104 (+),score=15.92 TRINITY_DN7637_c0_g1_i1:159-470(+)
MKFNYQLKTKTCNLCNKEIQSNTHNKVNKVKKDLQLSHSSSCSLTILQEGETSKNNIVVVKNNEKVKAKLVPRKEKQREVIEGILSSFTILVIVYNTFKIVND